MQLQTNARVTGARPPSVPPTTPAGAEASARRQETGRARRVTCSERLLAIALLVVATPTLALLASAVLLVDGWPAFYRGRRLGLQKRPFTMYKVRTLRREAQRRTATRLLRAGDGLEIAGGRLVRDSRLDELPQLWNVVRGDMRFVGPRPERPRIYAAQCRDIPGYDRRFLVHPGIVGPSQLFTPHSTSKRIRAWLDNAWARERQSIRALAGLVGYTVLAIGSKVVRRARLAVVDDLVRCRLLRRRASRRRLRRVPLQDACVRVSPGPGRPYETIARLIDMNEEAMLVSCSAPLEEGTTAGARLEVELAPGRPGGRRVRAADCEVVVVQVRRDALVLAYSPAAARSEYVLHQYFLDQSLASPRPRARTSTWPRPIPNPLAASGRPGWLGYGGVDGWLGREAAPLLGPETSR